MLTILSWLFSSALAASDPEPGLLIRVEDQRTRWLSAPLVQVSAGMEEPITVELRDDGSDPADHFARDRIWIGRAKGLPEGELRLQLIDQRNGLSQVLHSWSTLYNSRKRLVSLDIRKLALSTDALRLLQALEQPEEGKEGEEVSQAALPTDFPVSELLRQEQAFNMPQRWPGRVVLAALGNAGLVLLLGWLWLTRGQQVGELRRDARLERVVWWSSLVLLALMFLPALPYLASSFLGVEYVDHYGTQWFYWFVEDHLRKGKDPAHTDLFFYPWGKDIYGHTGANVLDAYAAIPFRMLLGPVLGYNIFVSLAMVASTWMFWRFTQNFTEDRFNRGLTTLLYSLMPCILMEANEGRPTQSITFFVVLFFDCLVRICRQPGWRIPVLGGLALALSGYQYWFFALFAGAAAGVHGLWRLVWPGETPGGRWWLLGRHAGMAAVAVALVLPSALPMIQATAEGGKVPGLIDTDAWTWLSTPPITVEGLRVAFYSWQPFTNLLGYITLQSATAEVFMPTISPYPWVFLLLVVLGLFRSQGKERALYLAMALVLTLIALGPIFMIFNKALPNPFYIALIKSLPFLKRLWWPARATLVATIPFCVFAIYGIDWLRRQPLRVQWVAFGLLIIGWGVDMSRFNMLPFKRWDAHVPAGYQCLSRATEGAVIELPFGWTQAHLYYQTRHGRPLMGGMLEDNPVFTPEELAELRSTNEMVGQLQSFHQNVRTLSWPRADEQELYDLGFRWLVVQKDAWFVKQANKTAELAMLESELRNRFGEPVFDDGRVGIWAPWGGTLDCPAEEFPRDVVPTGPTEFVMDDEGMDPNRQIFTRFFAKSEEESASAAEAGASP